MNRYVSSIVIAALLSLTACSSGSTSAAKPAVPSASTTSAATPSETVAPPPAPADRLLRKSQLRTAIVGIDELPAGYSVDRDQSSGKGNKTFCDYKVPQREKIKVFTDFIKGGGFSTQLIAVRLKQYASADAARESFDALTSTMKTCRGERYKGEKLHYSVMSVPKLGDARIGVRIEYDNGTNLSFYVLDGPVVVNVGGGGLLNVDADQLASVLRAQMKAYGVAAEQ